MAVSSSVYSYKSCQKDLMDPSQTTGELNVKWVKTHLYAGSSDTLRHCDDY